MDLTLIVDAVIAFTLIEVAALTVLHARTGRGLAPRDLLPTVLSGLLLMVGLRLQLAGAGAPMVALPMLLAGLAHALDLRRRWR